MFLVISQSLGGIPGSTVVKNLSDNAGNARDVSSIPGLRRSLGAGNGNPLQYFLRGKFCGQKMAGYSPWDRRVGHDWGCVHTRMHTHTYTHRRYQDSDIKQRDLYSHSWYNYTQNNWTHFVFLPFCFLWKWGYSFTWPQNSACSLPPITTLNSDPCCLPFMSTAFTDIFNCPDVSAASLLFQLSKPT